MRRGGTWLRIRFRTVSVFMCFSNFHELDSRSIRRPFVDVSSYNSVPYPFSLSFVHGVTAGVMKGQRCLSTIDVSVSFRLPTRLTSGLKSHSSVEVPIVVVCTFVEDNFYLFFLFQSVTG